MDRKELDHLIRMLAIHFGEYVSCERFSPRETDWIKWNNAEITTQFLIELEKGYIRNIQFEPNFVVIRAKLITTFDTFEEWLDKASSRLKKYNRDELVYTDQSNKILLSGREFLFARANNLFPVNVFRMTRNTA